MNSIIITKTSVCAAFGIIGSFVAQLFGGWSSDMTTLLIFMAVDFVMGLIVAGVFGRSDKSESGALDSKAGWRGLCKKCVTLLFVLVAHRLDLALGTGYVKSAAVIAFILNEIISITENAGLMGMPLPQVIKKAIDLLKERDDFENY